MGLATQTGSSSSVQGRDEYRKAQELEEARKVSKPTAQRWQGACSLPQCSSVVACAESTS